MRRISLVVLPVLGLVTLACPMKSAIWVVAGSTRDHLEFGISNKRGGTQSIEWGGLAIYDCRTDKPSRQHVYWVLERLPESWKGTWPISVTYGQAPIGFQSSRGPEALGPGCYEATVGGTGDIEFRLDSAGGVTELARPRGVLDSP